MSANMLHWAYVAAAQPLWFSSVDIAFRLIKRFYTDEDSAGAFGALNFDRKFSMNFDYGGNIKSGKANKSAKDR